MGIYMSEQRPFESAPKDGTEILAWHKIGKNWHPVSWTKKYIAGASLPVTNSIGERQFIEYWGMRWNTDYSQHDCDFTQWMFMPQLNVQKQEDEL